MPPSHTPETNLLQPVDPAQHSDDWPILELTGCDIFIQGPDSTRPDTSRGLISLLAADVRNPLVVQGKLSALPREHAHLKLVPFSGVEPVQIENVRQFAYGQYEDGRIDLWAAGTAGWYTIRPSRAYRSTYERMLQAVEMLYFCADVYGGKATKSRKGKSRQNVSAEDVMTRYAAANSITHDQAEGRFKAHARFLLTSMMSGKENVEWAKTNLWTWMLREHKDLFKEIQAIREQALLPSEKTGSKRKRSTASSTAAFDSVPAERPATARGRPKSSSRLSFVQPATPTMSSNPADSSDTDSVPAGRPQRARKGKSTLRPRTSKYIPTESDSTEAQSLAIKGPQRPPSDIDMGQSSPLDTSIRPGNMRRQRGNSRLVSALDLEDEGIDMSLDESHDSDSDSLSYIMIHPQDGTGKTVAIRLREAHMTATSAGDVWTCPLDGCMDRIYAASEPDSQRLIKEHYRKHVADDDAEVRLELVRKMQAPGLPMSRLVNRIQAFAGKKAFPQPIVQRF